MADSAPADLASSYRDFYRSAFLSDVASGEARPMVVPFDFVGSFILPVLYLSIPHVHRPWLYSLRFAVLALMAYLNLSMLGYASSGHAIIAYGSGLISAWGLIWGACLLVWTRPQFDAARVRRRPRRAQRPEAADRTVAPDESVATALDDYEYYWQPYPAEASFVARLDWAVDLATAFRGSGWNWAPSSVPRFQRPVDVHAEEPVKLETISLVTASGVSRFPTYSSLFWDKLGRTACVYLILDLVSVIAARDSYFIIGPDSPFSPPRLLSVLPAPVIGAWRGGVSLVGIAAALYVMLSVGQLLPCLLSAALSLFGAGSTSTSICFDLWQFTSVFGSFNNVLDHGLAGFWGGLWHQTFRYALVAPAAWASRHLRRRGRQPLPAVLVAFFAFAQSGALHAASSVAARSTPALWWPPLLFFLYNWLGIALQPLLARFWTSLGNSMAITSTPRWIRRAGNLVFVMLWLYLTKSAFLDDLSRAGVWLFEPVPFSPLRALGLGGGPEDDSCWRWGVDILPRWHVGKNWWESGLTI